MNNNDLHDIFGSQPSDHYFRSVCLSVCLFVCAEFFSAVFDLISIKLGHIAGSVHKGSISRNLNFSGNEFLCFASFTLLSFYQHALAIVY